MTLIYILVFSVCCLLSVDSIGYFPCARQALKQFVGVNGALKGLVFDYSCKHPSKVFINGNAMEIVNKAGPFVVLRRNGNEFVCFKEMGVDPKGLTVVVYTFPWIKRDSNPEFCEVCTASANWTLLMLEANNHGNKIDNKVKIPPLGCNVPVGCPLNNPDTDIPCIGCEPQEDDGLCCRACQQDQTYN